MAIPSRLSRTTLGDVLGELSREKISGTLELIEGGRGGPLVHEIVLRAGKIASVHSARGRSLGEHLGKTLGGPGNRGLIGDHLVVSGAISEERLRTALAEQRQERLEILFRLEDAEVRFRPRQKPTAPSEPEPVPTVQLLRGRARVRDRFQSETPRIRALRTLGLTVNASSLEIRQAFRTLARELHPDANSELPETERQACLARFSELSRAYHKLIA